MPGSARLTRGSRGQRIGPGISRAPSLEKRCKDLLEAWGWVADVVQFRQRGGKLKDLYECIDIVAVHETAGPLAIQVTTDPNKGARKKKIDASNGGTTWAMTTPLVLWIYTSIDSDATYRIFRYQHDTKSAKLCEVTLEELTCRASDPL